MTKNGWLAQIRNFKRHCPDTRINQEDIRMSECRNKLLPEQSEFESVVWKVMFGFWIFSFVKMSITQSSFIQSYNKSGNLRDYWLMCNSSSPLVQLSFAILLGVRVRSTYSLKNNWNLPCDRILYRSKESLPFKYIRDTHIAFRHQTTQQILQ